MKTITKILMLAGALAFVACGEVTESANIGVEGTISESLEGQTEDIISYGSISENKFYVSEGQQELAISRLKGELLDSTMVVFEVNNKKVQLRITPMAKLDVNQKIKVGDFGTLKNRVCHALTNEGKCINMVSIATGKFIFSMKIPKGGLSYCKKQTNETCDWVIVMYKGTTWTKKNCKGNPAGNKMVRICYDNNS